MSSTALLRHRLIHVYITACNGVGATALPGFFQAADTTAQHAGLHSWLPWRAPANQRRSRKSEHAHARASEDLLILQDAALNPLAASDIQPRRHLLQH